MPRQTANIKRALRAQTALKAYGCEQDQFDAIIALLCDLRHYCDSQSIGFAFQDRTAEEHYRGELTAPPAAAAPAPTAAEPIAAQAPKKPPQNSYYRPAPGPAEPEPPKDSFRLALGSFPDVNTLQNHYLCNGFDESTSDADSGL